MKKVRKARKINKVTYTCIDCGKQRTDWINTFNGTPPEKYRCKECFGKHKTSLSLAKRITRVCIECGTPRTARPELFSKSAEEYICRKCNLKKMHNDPEWTKNHQLGIERRNNNETWKENHKRAINETCKTEQWKTNHSIGIEKRSQNEMWLKNVTEANKKHSKDPIWRERQKSGAINKCKDSSWIENNKIAVRKRISNPNWQDTINNVINDPCRKEKYLITVTGEGFWYGHPTLKNSNNGKSRIYCEKFEEVDPRVRAFQGTKCLLCEKTEEENGKRLHDHHAFYEKKTCCWLDDNNDYWTNLNVRGHERDYYIGTNPNYFALLCNECHGKTNGGYENRKFWANTLKNIIDTKFNGKSYYTEEEMIEHGYIKISRTKWEKI